MIVTGSLSWGNGIKYHLKSNVEIKFVKRRDKVAKKSAKNKKQKKNLPNHSLSSHSF